MYSFSSYKDQCYNLGSPSPSPSCSPLNYLPAVSDEFKFSPVKGSPKTPIEQNNLKRKLDFDTESVSPSKKRRMLTKEEMEILLKNNNMHMEKALDKIEKKS